MEVVSKANTADMADTADNTNAGGVRDLSAALAPMLYFSRALALTKFKPSKGFVKYSNFKVYAVCFSIVNFALQLFYQINAVETFLHTYSLREFVWVFDILAYGLNDVVSPIVILICNEDLYRRLDRINKAVHEENLKKVYFYSRFSVIMVLITGAIFTSGHTFCDWHVRRGSSLRVFLFGLSLWFRISISLTLISQYCLFLLLIRTSYRTLNQNLHKINISALKQTRQDFVLYMLKNMRALDYACKDLAEEVRIAFSTYTGGTALIAFLEVLYTAVYEVMIRDYLCKSITGPCWIVYIIFVLAACLTSSVLTINEVRRKIYSA